METKAIDSLIERATHGDDVALRVILTHTRQDLCAYIAKKIPRECRHLVDAEDIVQAAHMSIFRNVDSVRRARTASFRRWLQAVALNRLRNVVKAYRTAKRNVALTVHSSGKRNYSDSTVALFDMIAHGDPTASRTVARREAVSLMEHAMKQLPRHYRQAVTLVHLEGLPVQEAGLVMGKSPRAIHALCRRALERLGAQLGDATKYLSSAG